MAHCCLHKNSLKSLFCETWIKSLTSTVACKVSCALKSKADLFYLIHKITARFIMDNEEK